MESVLEVRGLAKEFGGRPALLPVSFVLRRGEHLTVTGPSGSGKTTLLRLLAGLLAPSRGEVLEGGRVVNRRGWRLAPHRRRLGMLFQELALWPHLTALAQVEFALAPRLPSGARRRERRAEAERLLESVGLRGYAARYPAELSGGERQRVAWARAIAGKPALLLLDEPLTSLDPELREDLLRAMSLYAGTPGSTLVVVTHDPRTTEPVAARVLRLPARA